MDPNSQHQLWSLWRYRVYPDVWHRPEFSTVKTHAARFGRLLFGSASEMQITECTDDTGRLCWELSIRSEGHPVHDPGYVDVMHGQWRDFLRQGFGPAAEVQCHAHLESGDRQDGTPPDQLIVLPTLAVGSSTSPE